MIRFGEDSDKNRFQIWQQEQPESCGVAAIWMARGLVAQKSINEEEWSLAQAVYSQIVGSILQSMDKTKDDAPQTYDPKKQKKETKAHAVANNGFRAWQLRQALLTQGYACEHFYVPGEKQTIQTSKLADNRPVIALVWWNGGFGHFIVATRRASNGNIVWLDPMDGKVNEQANNGLFQAKWGRSGHIAELLYVSAA